MDKIVRYEQIPILIKQLKETGKKIVLVGGIFDLTHRGHVEFLEAAKREGDVLIVLLESDEKTREIKGKNRPINTQEDRAFVLSRLLMVDYIFILPYFKKDKDYEQLVKMLQPDIIAVTKGDAFSKLKERYAKMVGGKLIEVISRREDYSTTNIEDKI